jgi:sigma-B regulation protein RsbU (phosphoserine phosphatase)
MAAEGNSKLLWLGDDPVPPNLRQALWGRWELVRCAPDEPLSRQLAGADLAVAYLDGRANEPRSLEILLNALDRAAAVAVVMLPADAKVAWGVLSRRVGKFLCVRQDASPEELAAKLGAAKALQPAIRNLQMELAAARCLNSPAGQRAEEMDEEMRLAARLQRDFLPRRLPEVGPVRFGVLYRPASWVSGDIYDVTRLDETHVGFYVADAVGHGMPAALLTMFIKKALPTKRIAGNSYEILPPHESLGQLNEAICEQDLSSCQFCTAVYGVLDTADGALTYARAGHPAPILIRAGGSASALPAAGSLLGVFPEEQYESMTVHLAAGDRLILYTDGAEDALAGTDGGAERFQRLLASLADRPRDEVLLQLTSWIDEQSTPPHRIDDITVITVDVEP